jgi:2-methylisocitrate lyase-like PEP mutase family enzyme
MTQVQKAIAFKELHAGSQAFVMPNAWNAGSARLLEQLGFAALATTSAGLAYALGRPDGENAISRDETLANVVDIAGATSLPVSADLEGGFGAGPEACAETIRLAAGAGLVGGSIEDASGDPHHPIYSIEAATDRVGAAAEAARTLEFPFMLTARAENFLHGRPNLGDTIRRLQAFQEAGADVLYAPGLRTAEDIRAVTSSLDRPVNVIMGLQGVRLSVAELSSLGVRRISVGGALARAAYGAMLRGAKEILEHGTFGFAASAVPGREISGLFAARR